MGRSGLDKIDFPLLKLNPERQQEIEFLSIPRGLRNGYNRERSGQFSL